ncbi:TMX4 isoform 3 [Pongo abelii]|uniref:TMX4 isoform 3 n=1 Tax=Pongo abelii TaxID=9601 RepID=A0A2J8SU55_PONAB|nr:TMX4 isoform 3 [Pongo abelii]
MAGGRCGPQLTALLAAWIAAVAATAGPEEAALPPEPSRVQPMTASNWTLVMEGEWMLKLYRYVLEEKGHSVTSMCSVNT